MAGRVNWASYTQSIRRWGYALLSSLIIGAVIFVLPGTLTLFGIGATAAGNVAAAAAAMKMNGLIAAFGVTGTLGIVSGLLPSLVILFGTIRGFFGTINLMIDLIRGPSSDNSDSFTPQKKGLPRDEHGEVVAVKRRKGAARKTDVEHRARNIRELEEADTLTSSDASTLAAAK